MFCLRYHRQYLWIFFCSFLFLMCAALIVDCVLISSGSSSGSSSGTLQIKAPRFINVVFVFVFAAVSALLQHFLARLIIKPDLLGHDRRFWLNKFIKTKQRKRIKKIVKRNRYVCFVFSCMLANLVNYIPIIVLFVLYCTSTLDTLKSSNNIVEYFLIPALFVKYFSWYANAVISRFTMFKNNERLNINKN